MGKTSEGRNWYFAIIAFTENLKNIDLCRQLERRIAVVVKAMTEGNLPF
ncbi:MAG: hypothetical protein ACXU9G_10390 [Syntrophales bacterium]